MKGIIQNISLISIKGYKFLIKLHSEDGIQSLLLHKSLITMDYLVNKQKLILLSVFCVISLLGVLILLNENISTKERVDIRNTTCYISENIGRRIYLHICRKDRFKVYDLRYFWKNESQFLKPEIVGVQLYENEFLKLCARC